MRFLDSAIQSNRCHLTLLAPFGHRVSSPNWRICQDDSKYTSLLHGLQRVRAEVYLEDRAITETQLTADGRLWHPADCDSWQFVLLDDEGRILGCGRYHHHPPGAGLEDLSLRSSALARNERWGPLLRSAIEAEAIRARQRGAVLAEIGGWAITGQKRYTFETLRIPLAVFALAQLLGGSTTLTTATMRHHSAQVLRGVGGNPLTVGGTQLPPYYDPQYGCEMEVLRFYSDRPAPAYVRSVNRMREHLLSLTVIAPESARVESFSMAHTLSSSSEDLIRRPDRCA